MKEAAVVEAPSILREPKYAAASNSESSNNKPPVVKNRIVQEHVVERTRRRRKKPIDEEEPSGTSIEGYTPKTVRFEDNDEAVIYSSLADLMEKAGTLPKDTSDPQVVEADIAFRVMDPAAFAQEQQQDDEEENLVPQNEDDDDALDNDLWDFLGNQTLDDEDIQEAPPRRTFLVLWEALSQWVTPMAVAYIADLRGKPCASLELASDAASDDSKTRCDSLQANCQLHFVACWKQLDLPDDRQSSIQRQLAELIKCFDFRYPSPKLDLKHTKALIVVMMEMLLDQEPLSVPESCRVLDITMEEYKYLTRSAILSFANE